MADELRESPITVMVSPSLRKRIEDAAKQEDRSLSWWGQAAFEERLERQKKK